MGKPGKPAMIELSFPTVEWLFAALWLLSRYTVWLGQPRILDGRNVSDVALRQRRVDWKREARLLLMYVNLAVILRFTLFPMSRVNGMVRPLRFDPTFPLRVNVIPLVRLLDYDSRQDLLLNVVGNIGMFVPSGLILPALYKKLDGFWRVVGAGFLLSLCVEILQLPLSERASDVDDLIFNTLGTIIGYGGYALVKKARNKRDHSGLPKETRGCGTEQL